MSQRLLKKIQDLGKKRIGKPLIVYMTSGRSFDGDLVEVDMPSAVITLKVKDGVTHQHWNAMINMDSIEAVEPRWKDAT